MAYPPPLQKTPAKSRAVTPPVPDRPSRRFLTPSIPPRGTGLHLVIVVAIAQQGRHPGRHYRRFWPAIASPVACRPVAHRIRQDQYPSPKEPQSGEGHGHRVFGRLGHLGRLRQPPAALSGPPRSAPRSPLAFRVTGRPRHRPRPAGHRASPRDHWRDHSRPHRQKTACFLVSVQVRVCPLV